MSTCTIIIKIKDYFPKIDSIPYQNFICLFTNEDNEGQIPLVSEENESYQHQVKNVVSDIKYKIHVLDYTDMSLIGMCDMAISYNIISQISPPNGFIQEQQKKIIMDLKTKRKLFGTVLNMGDIYLNIYSEIYLNEKNNSSMMSHNSKVGSNKKNVISVKNSEFKKRMKKKKFDGSPRTVHKKQLMMEMKSDREVLINLNKNNFLNKSNIDRPKPKILISNNKKEKKEKKQKEIRQNSSFNYRDTSKENKNEFPKLNDINNILKNKSKQNDVPKKPIDKVFKGKDDYMAQTNFINKFKTEANKFGNNNFQKVKNNSFQKRTKKKDNFNSEKIIKGGINYLTEQNKNPLINNISPKVSNENDNENEDIQFNNNTGNKITTIESLENIDFSGKKYITKAKTKHNSQNNIHSNINNTLFSTNSTEQEMNDIDKIILEKGNVISNTFTAQLKNNIINDNDINFINKSQLEITNNLINLIDFYSLLNHKLFKINHKNNNLNNKYIIYKEKLFTELKKNNVLTQKKTSAEIENFINVNNHGALNEKFLRALIKLKKSEFKIYQNIFNLFYYEYDILKFKEFEKTKKMDEGVKLELLLVVFKNLLKNYGNVSQIDMNDIKKKNILKTCLNKYDLVEKAEGTISNLDKMQINNNLDKNSKLQDKDNNNDLDKFRIIKEEDEEKEDELDDEEDKHNINQNQNNNQIANNSTNTKDNNHLLNSNEKLESHSKINKEKIEQKGLFLNDDKTNNDNNNFIDTLKNGIIDVITDSIKENNKYDINEEYNAKLEEQKRIKNNSNNIIDDINDLINFNKKENEKNQLIKNEKLKENTDNMNDKLEIEKENEDLDENTKNIVKNDNNEINEINEIKDVKNEGIQDENEINNEIHKLNDNEDKEESIKKNNKEIDEKKRKC